jgi:hypothetical protein
MAGEITYQDPGAQTGLPLYAVVETVGGLILAGGTPEAFDAAHWASYVISLTDAGGGLYRGDFPAAPLGNYYREVYFMAGSSPASTDTQVGNDYPVAFYWPGPASAPLGVPPTAALTGPVPVGSARLA